MVSFRAIFVSVVFRSNAAVRVVAPASAYWSYWHATRGGKWVYSSTGAGTYKPAPGSAQGWAFGAGKAPSIPPPS